MADYRDEVLQEPAWRLQEAMRDHEIALRNWEAAQAESRAASDNLNRARAFEERANEAVSGMIESYRHQVKLSFLEQESAGVQVQQASPEPSQDTKQPEPFAVGSRVRVVRLIHESAPQMGAGRSATIGQEGYIGAFDMSTPGYPWWCSITVRTDRGTGYLTAFPYASRELERLPGWVERLPDDSVRFHMDEEWPSGTAGVVKLTWDQAEEVRAAAKEAIIAIRDYLQANERIRKGTGLALRMQEAHNRLHRIEEMVRMAGNPR